MTTRQSIIKALESLPDTTTIEEAMEKLYVLYKVQKGIELAERTGRGIDRIFEGLLRYGRSAPDYSRSDNTSVIVHMSNSEADFYFLEMILNQEDRTRRPMPLDSLIILSRLRHERLLTTSDLAFSTQKSEQETRAAL